MSWFSEITTKAEAMLVKLDQNAAEALQNPDKILKSNKILDQAISSISNNNVETTSDKISSYTTQEDRRELYADIKVQNETIQDKTSQNISDVDKDLNTYLNQSNEFNSLDSNYLKPSSSHNSMAEQVNSTSGSPKTDNDYKQADDSNVGNPLNTSDSSHTYERANILPTKKFTMQTSKSRSRNFTPEKRADRRINPSYISQSERGLKGAHSTEINSSISISSPGADDIRASINRSLQEYTLSLQTTQKSSRIEFTSTREFEQISNSSHFDDQPNLVQHASLLDPNRADNLKSNRISSSPSLSIDVPDDRSDTSGSRSDIASRLLQQSALKKKSTFYLHKVINRLAYPNSQDDAIISDQMKLRLRRTQMRLASYGRRLNYYFRTYPNLKYVVLIYLVLMQILVIYVLVFYQSSSSSNDLSTQIKQQQREMVGSRYESS